MKLQSITFPIVLLQIRYQLNLGDNDLDAPDKVGSLESQL